MVTSTVQTAEMKAQHSFPPWIGLKVTFEVERSCEGQKAMRNHSGNQFGAFLPSGELRINLLSGGHETVRLLHPTAAAAAASLLVPIYSDARMAANLES